MNPIIKIEHLAAGYEGKEVLHDVNLTIYQDDYRVLSAPMAAERQPSASYSRTDEPH